MQATNYIRSSNPSGDSQPNDPVRSSCTLNSLVRIIEYRRVIHETLENNEQLKKIATSKFAEVKKQNEPLVKSQQCVNMRNAYIAQINARRSSAETIRNELIETNASIVDCRARIEKLNIELQRKKLQLSDALVSLERPNKINLYLKAKLRQRQKQLLAALELLLPPTGTLFSLTLIILLKCNN
jgi:hypothetical protein